MSGRKRFNTASEKERLMDELVERLVSMSDARDSKDFPVNPLKADRGAAGESQCLLLPTSAASVTSCSCHQHDNLHVHLTIKCPCSRPSTAEASTQTDPSTLETPPAKCANEAGVTAPQPVREREENALFHKSSVQFGASSSKGAPSYRTNFSTQHGARPTTVTFAEKELSKDKCLRAQTSTQLFPASEEFSPRGSADERRRSVHKTLADVRETLLEVLNDSPRTVYTGRAAAPTSGAFETRFPTHSDYASLPALDADLKTESSSLQ
ncbi:hypothetical protein MRX96_048987, partial [Rhipicephalus microplus]